MCFSSHSRYQVYSFLFTFVPRCVTSAYTSLPFQCHIEAFVSLCTCNFSTYRRQSGGSPSQEYIIWCFPGEKMNETDLTLLCCCLAHCSLSMTFSKYLLLSKYACRKKKEVPLCTLSSARNERYSCIMWGIVPTEMDTTDMSSHLGRQDAQKSCHIN